MDAGREWRGGQNQVRLLCRGLSEQDGVSVTLVTRAKSELARRAAAAGVDVRAVPWRFAWNLVTVNELSRVLHAERPDIVHVHDAHALSVAKWAMALSWRPARPALVATRRVDFHLRRPRGWMKCQLIFAVSNAVKQVLVSDGIPAGLVRIVPDAVDPVEIRREAVAVPNVRARFGIPNDAPLAVNVAALVPHKDQATLLRAAALVRDRMPDLHWVIAGEGAERSALERMINELGLHTRARLVGYIEEANALINACDVLAMSSREEGLGSVVLHALALGKPVVATRAGGLPEIVPAPWVVDVGDAAALGDRVVTAITQKPRMSLPERHTLQAMVTDVVATYRALT